MAPKHASQLSGDTLASESLDMPSLRAALPATGSSQTQGRHEEGEDENGEGMDEEDEGSDVDQGQDEEGYGDGEADLSSGLKNVTEGEMKEGGKSDQDVGEENHDNQRKEHDDQHSSLDSQISEQIFQRYFPAGSTVPDFQNTKAKSAWWRAHWNKAYSHSKDEFEQKLIHTLYICTLEHKTDWTPADLMDDRLAIIRAQNLLMQQRTGVKDMGLRTTPSINYSSLGEQFNNKYVEPEEDDLERVELLELLGLRKVSMQASLSDAVSGLWSHLLENMHCFVAVL